MSERAKNDFYPTPPEVSQAIVRTLAEIIPAPRGIIESSAGTGSFVRACRPVWPGAFIMGVDIDPGMEPALVAAGADRVIIGDWEELIRDQRDLDVLMIGNDPFSVQIAHVTAGLKAQLHGAWHAKIGRFSLLESRERVPFWRDHPCRYMFPIVPRPNFMKGVIDPETGKKKNGDNSGYMLYVWKKGYTGRAELCSPIVWR